MNDGIERKAALPRREFASQVLGVSAKRLQWNGHAELEFVIETGEQCNRKH